MASFDSYSPLILLSLLGGLSIASIVYTFNSQDLPVGIPRERKIPNKDEVRHFQQGLQKAFSGLPSLAGLCHDPKATLLALNFGPGRQIVLDDPRWVEKRSFLPQNERDAWTRCQASSANEPRRRLCFHIASQKASQRASDSTINIVEMSLEWYGSDKKKPVECEAALSAGNLEEVALYYSFYWSDAKPIQGKEKWAFERMTGGLRLDPRQKAL